jgi:hypothetical protein
VNCRSIGFKDNIMNNSSVGCDQVEDENILTEEITDRALEAAASGPTVTLTLSIVLFACQFCPSDRASNSSAKPVPDGRTRQLHAEDSIADGPGH